MGVTGMELLLDIFTLFFGNHLNHFDFDHQSVMLPFVSPKMLISWLGQYGWWHALSSAMVRESFMSSQSLQIPI